MGKIKNWLIRLLGGCTRAEMEQKDAQIALLSRCPNDVKKFSVERKCFIDRRKDRNEQNRRNRRMAAMQLADALMDVGLIEFEKILLPIQFSGPVSAYRLRAAISVLDQRYTPEGRPENGR